MNREDGVQGSPGTAVSAPISCFVGAYASGGQLDGGPGRRRASPISQFVAALKEIQAPQCLLGKKTMEIEILRNAVEYGRS